MKYIVSLLLFSFFRLAVAEDPLKVYTVNYPLKCFAERTLDEATTRLGPPSVDVMVFSPCVNTPQQGMFLP